MSGDGYVIEPPTVNVVDPSQIQHGSLQDRFGDLQAAMEQQGRSLHEVFGGADRGHDAIGPDGRFGEESRVPDSFLGGPRPRLMNPTPPPQPGITPPVQRYEGPPHGDPGLVNPVVDARSQEPPGQYRAPQGQPYPTPPVQQPGYPMTQEEYLQATGNAAPQTFGPPKTPNEVFLEQQLGQLRNEFGEVRRMLDAAMRMSPEQAREKLARDVGLTEMDPNTPLTPSQMQEVLANFAGVMYNEFGAQGGDQGVDPAVAARQRQNEQMQNYGSAPAHPTPPTHSGGVAVPNPNFPATIRPSMFVERGPSAPNFEMTGQRQPRQNSTYDQVMAMRQAGQYVPTEMYRKALRERGVAL